MLAHISAVTDTVTTMDFVHIDARDLPSHTVLIYQREVYGIHID